MKKPWLHGWLLGLFGWLLIGSACAQTADILNVRIWQAPDNTRLVFDLSTPVQYKAFQVENPNRLVLDISNSVIHADLAALDIKGSLIEGLRSGIQDGTTTRIVIDLKQKLPFRDFSLAPNKQYGNRLVVDLLTPDSAAPVIAPAVVSAPSLPAAVQTTSVSTNPSSLNSAVPVVTATPVVGPSSANNQPKPAVPISSPSLGANGGAAPAVSTAPVQVVSTGVVSPSAPAAPVIQAQPLKSENYRDIIIAVDAGHGGEDPGAIGAGGLREKDVVLSIARQLAQMLDKEPGFKAYLTRRGDYYVDLRKRTRLAREANADMFVSIHADAFKNDSARGASVWTLSERGATSEMGRWLAQTENNADLIGGVGGVSLDDKDEVLAGVLLDLSMTGTLKLSDQVGKDVLGQVGRIARLHKNHVERAGFVVLKSPDIPSILVETGFISNSHEASQLRTKSYQQQLATSIFNGIKHHFYSQPQPNTWIAAKVRQPDLPVISATALKPADRVLYKVGPGDTLSAIAARNKVSLSRLLRENDLDHQTVIKVGQVLVIPSS